MSDTGGTYMLLPVETLISEITAVRQKSNIVEILSRVKLLHMCRAEFMVQVE